MKSLLRTAFVVGATWFFVGQLARTYRVEGASMIPTLRSGERILISPLFGVERGDLIVFRSPRDAEVTMVKRVVALPGDTVRFEPGGKPAPELLPDGRYFVVGDNRRRSRDSRHFGALPESDILGVVFFRYWPPERLGRL